MSSSYRLDEKTSIEASCIYNIYTMEKNFVAAAAFKG